jgi:hypothetical protein
VINEIGAVFNVRIEGDTDANLFYTDATNSRVGVGLINPTEKFEVVGNIKLSGNVIPASGFGIDFAATAGTGTSELLADYEEGDWTPTFTGSTTDPTVTYSVQVGRYTKVGRTVTVSCRINLSAATGGSGNLRVSGLPFATLNVGNAIQTTAYAYKVAWTTLGPEAGYSINNSTNVFLFAGTATGLTSITTADLSATSQLIFNFTYQAN